MGMHAGQALRRQVDDHLQQAESALGTACIWAVHTAWLIDAAWTPRLTDWGHALLWG